MLTEALEIVQRYIDSLLQRGMKVPDIIETLRSRPLPDELTGAAIDDAIPDKWLYRASQLLSTGYFINIARERIRGTVGPDILF